MNLWRDECHQSQCCRCLEELDTPLHTLVLCRPPDHVNCPAIRWEITGISTVSTLMRHSWCSFDSLMFFIGSKGFINKLNQSPLDFRIHTNFCHTTKSKGILPFNSDKYYRNKFELLFITIIISKDFKTSNHLRTPDNLREKTTKKRSRYNICGWTTSE